MHFIFAFLLCTCTPLHLQIADVTLNQIINDEVHEVILAGTTAQLMRAGKRVWIRAGPSGE